MLTDKEQKKAAQAFAKRWQGHGYEKGEGQKFWFDLLQNVYGVENPAIYMDCEVPVQLEHTSFIDVYLPATRVMIEQKSLGKDLSRAIRQSDGSMLTPMQQLKRYAAALGYFKYPRWGVTCNFSEFYIYDMGQPNGEPSVLRLEELPQEYHRLNFLVDTGDDRIQKELEISLNAGTLVARLYESLLEQYGKEPTEEMLKSLNMLIVRIVFCLYAEDAGILGHRNIFHDYLADYKPHQFRRALLDLFDVLDTPASERDPYLEENLAKFPYVNGGLFAGSCQMIVPQFDEDLVGLIMDTACPFDWAGISPTIFGAVFESTLSSKVRRSGGMHYTSLENIHKVIDPLFLNDLKAEYESIIEVRQENKQKRLLEEFQDKLAGLVFFDPACGSGNFLTETYISLRRLENQVIARLNKGQVVLGEMANPVKVSIQNFYGIEINDFACVVAKTAMWIAELQMLEETRELVEADIDLLPLKTYVNIIEGNALQTDWEDVVPRERCSYIMGNPPFVGARMMKAGSAQKADMANIFAGWKNFGNLDYVCCWYKKGADYMKDTSIRSALVSTNSVSQGDTVAILWKPLFEEGIKINFAYRTFVWNSESNNKAHVHCVIIGFSYMQDEESTIFTDNQSHGVKNINGYLIEADNVFVESRNTPLCNVPSIGIGNKPVDGGYYLFEKEEMNEFIAKEPKSKNYFKEWYGAREFIHRKPRYCLWLGDCTPHELKSMPLCLKQVQAVREYRLASPSAGTRKIADKPTRFHVENMPTGTYIVIPQVSSQNRRYVPMGYMDDSVLCSDKLRLMPNAGLYEFGILESNVHMSWLRVVCCRLKSDYSYSNNIVYNNFPWPSPTDAQRAKIEKTAQAILDARALYPDSSLADLYDEVLMPAELRRAHQANDRAVMEAYGFWGVLNTESECVARLMEMYRQLTQD